MGLAVCRLGIGDEIDARRAVQLTHHNPLGAIDDELTPTEHDRHVAEVNLFLDRLLTGQPQQHPQRSAIRHPQLTALVRIVPRLSKFVSQILELDGLVVALDREDFPQHSFDALVLPLRRQNVVLEKRIVEPRLDLGEIRNRLSDAAAAVGTNLGGLETADGTSCHKGNRLLGEWGRLARSGLRAERRAISVMPRPDRGGRIPRLIREHCGAGH